MSHTDSDKAIVVVVVAMDSVVVSLAVVMVVSCTKWQWIVAMDCEWLSIVSHAHTNAHMIHTHAHARTQDPHANAHACIACMFFDHAVCSVLGIRMASHFGSANSPSTSRL